VVKLAELTSLPVTVVWALAAIVLALTGGSALRVAGLVWSQETASVRFARVGSLVTWWLLCGLLVAIVVLGKAVGAAVFAILSLVGMNEYRLLAHKHIERSAPWWCAFAAVPIHYLLIGLGWSAASYRFIPVWVLLAVLTVLVVRGQPEHVLETAGIIFLGLMLIVFLLSHAVLTLALPTDLNPVAGGEGLFIYVVVLTQWNDIAQALVGRRWGRRRIAPRVSPKKTWEGFLAGGAMTVVAAVLLAPWLTPFGSAPAGMAPAGLPLPGAAAVAACVLIAVGGFLGDIIMSAIKREARAKNSGSILPGQGGLLDRVDSLIVTAPLFYYFTRALYD
jgi:phosphatidate cytidylyltransferase